ncbi:MAG: B12-binding domain-containing radical SAM protein [Oscillospiraceae bacterium]|nr:B12-binding domain-containing radical SAM protein [Oscillospiraceae bacterium]
MRILLLLPWETDYKAYRDKFSTKLTYAPLTLVALAAMIPPEFNAQVDVCDEMVQSFSYDTPYDIVAISFVTSSAIRAYKIAKSFREKGAHVVFGGYHTTFMPDEAAQHADTIIVGPAEKAFPQFLRDYADKKPQARYEMTCIMPEDCVIPRRDLLPKKGYLNVPCVVANRGCPNRCEFCAISAMNPPCPRPAGAVIDEIASLKTKRLIFFDPNFFYNKSYALEIMDGLKNLNIKWACNATVQTAFDNELVEAAQKSRCGGVLFGLESLNRDTMLAVKKGFNDPKKYKQAIEIMQAHNISVNGCFVLGFDYDTKESLLTLPQQVEYLGANIVRYAILTPVPGSKLFNRLNDEGRIITTDWTKYTQNKAVFQPKNMSPQELEEIYQKVWRDSYKLGKVLKRANNAPWGNKPLLLGANLGFKYVSTNLGR